MEAEVLPAEEASEPASAQDPVISERRGAPPWGQEGHLCIPTCSRNFHWLMIGSGREQAVAGEKVGVRARRGWLGD